MSICDNNILEIIGEFSGLKIKDDRRFKQATPGTIRIRGLSQKLHHWEPVYEKVSLEACKEHNKTPTIWQEAWKKKNLKIRDWIPFTNQYSGPFYLICPDDFTTYGLQISVYHFFGKRYFVYKA